VKVKGELAIQNEEFSKVKGEGEIPLTFLPSPACHFIPPWYT